VPGNGETRGHSAPKNAAGSTPSFRPIRISGSITISSPESGSTNTGSTGTSDTARRLAMSGGGRMDAAFLPETFIGANAGASRKISI